jgi:hypothetical protein
MLRSLLSLIFGAGILLIAQADLSIVLILRCCLTSTDNLPLEIEFRLKACLLLLIQILSVSELRCVKIPGVCHALCTFITKALKSNKIFRHNCGLFFTVKLLFLSQPREFLAYFLVKSEKMKRSINMDRRACEEVKEKEACVF